MKNICLGGFCIFNTCVVIFYSFVVINAFNKRKQLAVIHQTDWLPIEIFWLFVFSHACIFRRFNFWYRVIAERPIYVVLSHLMTQPAHYYLALSFCSSTSRASIFFSRSPFCLFSSSFSAISCSTSVSLGAPRLFLMKSITFPGFSGSS